MNELRWIREKWMAVSALRKRQAAVASFLALTLAFLCEFAVVVLGYEGRFSPDSVVYVDIARNILAGNGLKSSLVPLDDALNADSVPPEPMTMYAPGYPLAIALLAKSGMPVPKAALIVSLISFGVVLLAAFLLMNRIWSLPAAMLGVALLVGFYPLRSVTCTAWSETSAMALMLLFFYFAMKKHAERRHILAAGVMAGLAFAARYATLPLLIVGIVAFLERDLRKSAGKVSTFLAGFLLISGPIFVRNLLVDGSMLGRHIPREMFGYIEVCARTLRVLSDGYESCAPVLRLLCLTLCVVAFGAAYFQFRNGGFRHLLSEALYARKQYLIALWIAIYIAMLVRSEVYVAIDPVNDRLLVPASAMGVLLVAGVLSSMMSTKSWIAASFAIGALVLSNAPDFAMASAIWSSKMPRAYDFNVERNPAYAWISRNVSQKDLLIAEDCFMLPLFAGPIRMIYFESPLPPANPLEYEQLARYLAKHRAEYDKAFLVLRAGLGAQAARSDKWGSFLQDIEKGVLQPYPGVSQEAAFEDARVFRIEPPQRP